MPNPPCKLHLHYRKIHKEDIYPRLNPLTFLGSIYDVLFVDWCRMDKSRSQPTSKSGLVGSSADSGDQRLCVLRRFPAILSFWIRPFISGRKVTSVCILRLPIITTVPTAWLPVPACPVHTPVIPLQCLSEGRNTPSRPQRSRLRAIEESMTSMSINLDSYFLLSRSQHVKSEDMPKEM